MADVKIQYYEVLRNTPLLEYDATHNVATPVQVESKYNGIIEQGKYVKSFGIIKPAKTGKGKTEVLVLVNNNAVRLADVKLYKDQVDDCGCDGNPIALPTEVAKALQAEVEASGTNDYSVVPKDYAPESKFMTAEDIKSKFDKSAIIGLLVGMVLIATAVWWKTKSKSKTAIGAVMGAIMGFIIGYFIGKRGEKRIGTFDHVADTEATSSETFAGNTSSSSTGTQREDAEQAQFLQVGNTYDFTPKWSAYVMTLENGVLYRAKDANGNKMIVKAKGKWPGKLVQIDAPSFFVFDQADSKIAQIQSNKPLPFIDLGNNFFIPLAITDASANITADELNQFLAGLAPLSEESYVKGRYAGKRLYNLVYMSNHDAAIRSLVGGS